MFFKHLRQRLKKPCGSKTRQTGDFYEDLAAIYLKKRGLEILGRNITFKFGELDIVARRRDSLHFVEVRARREGSLSSPLETVTYGKIKKIRNAALAYLSGSESEKLGLDRCHCHFDVISIEFHGESHNIEWIEDAFE